jgi:hypothetical protein
MKTDGRLYRNILAVNGIILVATRTMKTSWADDGRELAGKSKFTIIDFSGAAGTMAFGINLRREIVGNHNQLIFSPLILTLTVFSRRRRWDFRRCQFQCARLSAEERSIYDHRCPGNLVWT